MSYIIFVDSRVENFNLKFLTEDSQVNKRQVSLDPDKVITLNARQGDLVQMALLCKALKTLMLFILSRMVPPGIYY